jgi:hypothetical protein
MFWAHAWASSKGVARGIRRMLWNMMEIVHNSKCGRNWKSSHEIWKMFFAWFMDVEKNHLYSCLFYEISLDVPMKSENRSWDMCTIRNQVHGILWTWSIWAWTESTDISCAKCEGLQIPDRLSAITGWKSLAHSRSDIIPCSRKISGQSRINVILLSVHSVQDTNLCIYCGAQ